MSNRKKSFTGQIFDFILDDKNFNKKNMTILVIVLGIIGVLGVTSFLDFGNEADDLGGYTYYTPEYRSNVLEEFGYSKAEIEKMDEDTLNNISSTLLTNTRNQIAGDGFDGEYPYEKSMDTRTKFYQYASNGDFDSIIEEYQKIKDSNYLSQPYNQKLIRIYNDAYAIRASLSDKYNLEMQKSALSNLNDERMLLIMLLSSETTVRNSILKDRMSLTLSKDDNLLKINYVSSSSMKYNAENLLYKNDSKMERMFNYLIEGDFIVYKINFNIGTDVFNAYMYKDLADMKLFIYGIYADETYNKNDSYITVAESEEIFSNMDRYNNSLNGSSTDDYSDIYTEESEDSSSDNITTDTEDSNISDDLNSSDSLTDNSEDTNNTTEENENINQNETNNSETTEEKEEV